MVDDLRAFEWNKILSLSASLDDLNDRQWRFLKGFTVETITEIFSTGLVYVGDVHKDYDWPKHNLTVELKSMTSGPMYGKRGAPRKNFTIKLNNSNGTNYSTVLPDADVADLLIVVCSNGAFALDRETVIKNAKSGGDGWTVTVNRSDIVELSGNVKLLKIQQINIKNMVTEAIKKYIFEQKF